MTAVINVDLGGPTPLPIAPLTCSIPWLLTLALDIDMPGTFKVHYRVRVETGPPAAAAKHERLHARFDHAHGHR